MIDVTSTINTNALPAIHAAAQQLGFALNKTEISAIVIGVRWLHLEAPTIWQAAKWIKTNGGLIPLVKGFLGLPAKAGGNPQPGGIITH